MRIPHLLVISAILCAASGSAATPAGMDLHFQVTRDGSPIGRHRIDFRREGRDLVVDIAIDLEVNFAFLTVFRYSHRNREVWRDGRLVALDSTTNDDGVTHWVRARALETEPGILVESDSDVITAPPDAMTTSYWNPETVNRSRLLNTQDGRMIEVSVKPMVDAGDSRGPRGYTVSGDLDLEIWYGEGGSLSRIAFEARGSQIDYRPASPHRQREALSNGIPSQARNAVNANGTSG